MFVKTLLKYKWFVMCSIVMTGLMIASSLLQPWLLKQVLDALQMSDSKAIYQVGAWLIGMGIVGLLAGGINVTTAAYIAQAVSSDLREKTFRKIQTLSYANIEQFNAGNLVVRMTNDINQTSPETLPENVAVIVAEIQALLGDEYPITVKPITEEDLE